MKRALFIAGWAVLAAGPVRADLTGALDPMTPRNDLQHLNPNGGGTVGVVTAGGGLFPNTAVTPTYSSPIVGTLNLYPNISDYITLTFGIHWPYATAVLVSRYRHGLNWDTDEVVLVGHSSAGPFTTNNVTTFGTTPAAQAAAINAIVGVTGNSSGIGEVGIVGIEELVTPGAAAYFIINGSDVVPFARMTFHVKDPFGSDDLVDIIMPQFCPTSTCVAGIIFSFFTTSMVHTSLSSSVTNINPTSGLFINFGSSTPSAGVAIKPEPASAALLGMGALALTGGFWRRRRRSHDQSGWPRSYATWGRDFSSE